MPGPSCLPALRRALLAVAIAAPASGQEAATTAQVYDGIVSMGQPLRWRPYVGGYWATGWNGDPNGGGALFGVYHPIGSPVTGVLGISAEGYGTIAGSQSTGGLRGLLAIRAISTELGADWDMGSGEVDFLLSFAPAMRRGGILGRGTTARLDWLPSRDHQTRLGVTVPMLQPYAGRTRPRETGVDLPAPRPAPGDMATTLPADADSALARMRIAALFVRAYLNFFSDGDESSQERALERFRQEARRGRELLTRRDARYPQGRTWEAVTTTYHAEMATAFGIAAGSDGVPIARRARAILLDEVILPYDALFGRVKNGQRNIEGLTSRSLERFAAWVRDSSGVAVERRPAVITVQRRVHDVVSEIHREQVKQWDDSRLLWLPPQLALATDEHDQQREIDALVARVTGGQFTDANDLTLLRSIDLQVEFARTIWTAEDYHVLWLHDYVGRRSVGDADRIGFAMTADVYLQALTNRVRGFDRTGKLPAYFLILDQNFYEPADGRLWMSVLENPLDASVELPKGEGRDSLAARLRQRQRELREAVAASPRLRAMAMQRGGERWLRSVVKVHVNITQPSDFTYRSHRIIPPLPFVPDNLMRDHRKIAFRDLSESDPSAGEMILAGAGVGEQYASPTWEDRALRVRGPATLEVRAALRRLLRANGFPEEQIPVPLRERPAAALRPPTDLGRYVGRAMQAHNEPGFGLKRSSAARAMLFSLMPAGSVMVVPDPLWLGAPWAGMVAGAALRGTRVFVIAPALTNAPSAGFPQLARAYDVFIRLLEIAREFEAELRASGGELRVGLFASSADVNDIAAQFDEISAGVKRAPWLRTVFPFPEQTFALMDTLPAALRARGYVAVPIARDAKPRLPQLHQKTQLFMTRAALEAGAARPEWTEFLLRTQVVRARQTAAGLRDLSGADAVRNAAVEPAVTLAQEFLQDVASVREPLAGYFTLGTQNMDPRGLMLDGEATFVVSGVSSLFAVPDMFYLMARCTWITTKAELDRLLPPFDDWQRRLGRYIQFAL